MRKTKEQKGITLIALIITIIVLLILAVVAIGAVQNDGIINYAKNARDEYGKAQTNEQTTLGNYLAKLNENTGNLNNGSGAGSTETRAYQRGDIVTVGGETFYVLEDSAATDDTIILLAKECIDVTDSENPVQSSTNVTIMAFSKTTYWENEFPEGETSYNLTETSKPINEHYAALAAYNYGAKLGGKGRLITYNEAYPLSISKYRKMIFNTEEQKGYWFGTAATSNTVYCVLNWSQAGGSLITDMDVNGDNWALGLIYGARPVVEISKDKVTFVSENEFVDCETCNNTGKIEGYRCPKEGCGRISKIIESEIIGYSFWCPAPCNITNRIPVGEELICESCGQSYESADPLYNITYTECGCVVEDGRIPEVNEHNCPDC